VIDIFTSEDMENISLCIFQYLTLYYIIIQFICWRFVVYTTTRDVATGGVWGGVTPPQLTQAEKNQVKSQKVKKKNQVNLRSTYTSKQ
jgi:hypothetical protein